MIRPWTYCALGRDVRRAATLGMVLAGASTRAITFGCEGFYCPEHTTFIEQGARPTPILFETV